METTESRIESRKYAEMKRRGLLADVIEGDNVLIFKSRTYHVNNKKN